MVSPDGPVVAAPPVILTLLSFLSPIALWCLVSYVPFIWHPMVMVSNPGDVDWFTNGLLVDNDAFDAANAKIVARAGRVAAGEPANPVFYRHRTGSARPGDRFHKGAGGAAR